MTKKLKYLGLRENIISEISKEILKEDKSNLSDYIIVFPSKRMGIFLRDELSGKSKGNILLPDIFTIDEFVFYLYELTNSGALRLNDIEAILILYEILIEKDNFGDYGIYKDRGFTSNYPVLLKIFKAMEEISVESENFKNIDFLKFQTFVKLGDYHKDYTEFIKSLPELIEVFYEKVKKNKRYTRGLAYSELTEWNEKLSDELSDKKIIFAGFNALSYAEKRILKNIFDNFNSLFIMRGDKNSLKEKNSPFHLQAEAIQALGFSGEEIEYIGEDISWKSFNQNIKIHSTPDIENEMHLIKNILKNELLKENKSELKKIGIVLANPSSLIPFVQTVVSSFEKDEIPPFNITLSYPFSRTPLFQLIDSILTLRENFDGEKFPAKDYLSVIRHPYAKLSEKYEGEELLRIGIHRIEDIISTQNMVNIREKELFEILENEINNKNDDERIIEEIRELHENFIFKGETLGEFLDFIKKTLFKIAESGEGGNYLFLNEFISTAMESVERLESFIGEKSDFTDDSDFKSIRLFLKSYLANTRINFTGSPLKGIQIMGLMGFRGLNFDKIIIADAVEGILPSNFKYDPILPADIRKVFSMRTYKERETLIAYDFYSLINSAEDVRIFIPQKISEEVTEPSRFIERIIYEREKQGEKIDIEKAKTVFSVKERSLKKIKKSERIKEELKKFRFSPSSIDMYVSCPLSFYYSKVLGLKEKDDLEDDPDAASLGSIVHDALKEIYSDNEIFNGRKDFKIIKEKVNKIIDENFKKHNFDLENGIIKIKVWAVKEKILRFLKKDIERIKERKIEIKKDWLEKDLNKKISFNNNVSATFNGRIDRIEKEGAIYRIIDYKTGKDIKGIKPNNLNNFPDYSTEEDRYLKFLTYFKETFPSLQILIYIMLYSEIFKEEILNIDGAYVFLKKPEPAVETIFQARGKKFDINVKSGLFTAFKKNLSLIIYDIYNNDYFIPNPNSDNCSYCPFKTLCGNV